MAHFTVYFKTVASFGVTIEAADSDEAQALADEIQEFPTICAQCSGWGQDIGIELGDTWEQDGEVESR